MSFDYCLWIGGAPCSGKSSIAKQLAVRFGLGLYHCDDAYEDHLKRGVAAGLPISTQFATWNWEQIFLRPVEDMVRDEVGFYLEEWRFILEDISQIKPPLIVEGAAAMPELVATLKPKHAVWIVPTEDFQRHHYAQREWAHQVVGSTPNPAQAFENWMQRDAQFARTVQRQAEALGFLVLVVDGKSSLEENLEWTAKRLRLL